MISFSCKINRSEEIIQVTFSNLMNHYTKKLTLPNRYILSIIGSCKTNGHCDFHLQPFDSTIQTKILTLRTRFLVDTETRIIKPPKKRVMRILCVVKFNARRNLRHINDQNPKPKSELNNANLGIVAK